MHSLRRMYVSFVLAFDIVGFGVMFLIMSNSNRVGDLFYIAERDAALANVIAAIGVVANIGLAWKLWRDGHRMRRQAPEHRESRSRITGE